MLTSNSCNRCTVYTIFTMKIKFDYAGVCTTTCSARLVSGTCIQTHSFHADSQHSLLRIQLAIGTSIPPHSFHVNSQHWFCQEYNWSVIPAYSHTHFMLILVQHALQNWCKSHFENWCSIVITKNSGI